MFHEKKFRFPGALEKLGLAVPSASQVKGLIASGPKDRFRQGWGKGSETLSSNPEPKGVSPNIHHQDKYYINVFF